MMTVAGLEAAPRAADDSFWADELPQLAIAQLLGASDPDLYDDLIVDEAQDVIRSQYLDVLDLSIKGGLSAGRWRFFGDFERQAIFGQDDRARDSLLRHRARDVAQYSLRVNCRNTPRIAEYAQVLGGLSPRYSRVLRPDDGVEPELVYYDDAADQGTKLSHSLSLLYDDGFRGPDITVLSVRARESCANQLLVQPWRDRLRPVENGGPAAIGHCSIHAFKGLESRAIVVTDVEQIDTAAAQALFYVATTRALHRLIILARSSVRNQARDIVRVQLEGMD
jgi:superfamily I DNA/RNA helicase